MTATQWRPEDRYQPYDRFTPEYIAKLKAAVQASPWRTRMHIQPATGYLNDPCSFNYFNGKWHLYYQQFPFGPVNGLRSWAHLVSLDLVHWKRVPGDLLPDNDYDQGGCYTGSGYVENNALKLMYTGNAYDEHWQRHTSQMAAVLGPDNRLAKDPIPIIAAPPAGFTQEFRDPFIFTAEDHYYALIGAQRQDHTGAILLYRKQAENDWRFVTPLDLPDEFCGTMVECPNVAFVDGKVVLLYCPQGLSQDFFEYENVYPNIALVADNLDLTTGQLQHVRLQNIDKGFDFYASRLTVAPTGEVLQVAWLGTPGVSYPSDRSGWAHVLSSVRELHVINDKVVLNPISAIASLRTEANPITQTALAHEWQLDGITGAFDLSFTLAAGAKTSLQIPDGEGNQLTIRLDSDSGQGSVERPHNTSGGELRQFGFPAHEALNIRLLVDVSVFELFIGDGRRVVSGRFFGKRPPAQLVMLGRDSLHNIQAWNLEAANQGLA